MKKLFAGVLTLSLAACANLTAQQQANLQLQLAVGKQYVVLAGTVYCQWEPVTSEIVGIFDASKGTTTFRDKLDKATITACNAAVASGVIIKGA